MRNRYRWRIQGLLAAACACAMCSGTPAATPETPNRPVRIVVAATPGGGPDTVMRLLAPRLGTLLGQTVVIDNRAGAGGNLAAEIVAKSTPDGNTLLVSVPTLTTSPGLYRKLGYDVFRDFSSVSLLTTQPYMLVVHPSVPVRNVAELIAFAGTKKKALSYASPGIGQLAHLGFELLLAQGRFEALHVPYKGASLAIVDVLAGRVELFMVTPASSRDHIISGRLRAIAATGENRSLTFPDIPTIAEQGLPDYKVDGWYGLHAPAGTPGRMVERLRGAAVESFRDKSVEDGLRSFGVRVVASTPQQLDAFLKADYEKWLVLIKKLGITPE